MSDPRPVTAAELVMRINSRLTGGAYVKRWSGTGGGYFLFMSRDSGNHIPDLEHWARRKGYLSPDEELIDETDRV